MSKLKLALISGIAALSFAAPAEAYIGPGAGAGAIAVVFGILAAIAMAFVALVWYPLKRILKKTGLLRTKAAPEGPADPS